MITEQKIGLMTQLKNENIQKSIGDRAGGPSGIDSMILTKEDYLKSVIDKELEKLREVKNLKETADCLLQILYCAIQMNKDVVKIKLKSGKSQYAKLFLPGQDANRGYYDEPLYSYTLYVSKDKIKLEGVHIKKDFDAELKYDFSISEIEEHWRPLKKGEVPKYDFLGNSVYYQTNPLFCLTEDKHSKVEVSRVVRNKNGKYTEEIEIFGDIENIKPRLKENIGNISILENSIIITRDVNKDDTMIYLGDIFKDGISKLEKEYNYEIMSNYDVEKIKEKLSRTTYEKFLKNNKNIVNVSNFNVLYENTQNYLNYLLDLIERKKNNSSKGRK